MHVGVAGEHEQAGGVAVEPVHDSGALRVDAARQPAREEPVHERGLSQPRGRMRDEPRGLVDDEQVLVLEHDVQVELDRLEARPWILELDLDLLAAAQPERLAGDVAVDRDPPGRDVPLRRRPRADLRVLGEEAVETDAARVARCREREHF